MNDLVRIVQPEHPIRRWAAKNNVELCFTPTNASRANPMEAQFGPA